MLEVSIAALLMGIIAVTSSTFLHNTSKSVRSFASIGEATNDSGLINMTLAKPDTCMGSLRLGANPVRINLQASMGTAQTAGIDRIVLPPGNTIIAQNNQAGTGYRPQTISIARVSDPVQMGPNLHETAVVLKIEYRNRMPAGAGNTGVGAPTMSKQFGVIVQTATGNGTNVPIVGCRGSDIEQGQAGCLAMGGTWNPNANPKCMVSALSIADDVPNRDQGLAYLANLPAADRPGIFTEGVIHARRAVESELGFKAISDSLGVSSQEIVGYYSLPATQPDNGAYQLFSRALGTRNSPGSLLNQSSRIVLGSIRARGLQGPSWTNDAASTSVDFVAEPGWAAASGSNPASLPSRIELRAMGPNQGALSSSTPAAVTVRWDGLYVKDSGGANTLTLTKHATTTGTPRTVGKLGVYDPAAANSKFEVDAETVGAATPGRVLAANANGQASWQRIEVVELGLDLTGMSNFVHPSGVPISVPTNLSVQHAARPVVPNGNAFTASNSWSCSRDQVSPGVFSELAYFPMDGSGNAGPAVIKTWNLSTPSALGTGRNWDFCSVGEYRHDTGPHATNGTGGHLENQANANNIDGPHDSHAGGNGGGSCRVFKDNAGNWKILASVWGQNCVNCRPTCFRISGN